MILSVRGKNGLLVMHSRTLSGSRMDMTLNQYQPSSFWLGAVAEKFGYKFAEACKKRFKNWNDDKLLEYLKPDFRNVMEDTIIARGTLLSRHAISDHLGFYYGEKAQKLFEESPIYSNAERMGFFPYEALMFVGWAIIQAGLGPIDLHHPVLFLYTANLKFKYRTRRPTPRAREVVQ